MFLSDFAKVPSALSGIASVYKPRHTVSPSKCMCLHWHSQVVPERYKTNLGQHTIARMSNSIITMLHTCASGVTLCLLRRSMPAEAGGAAASANSLKACMRFLNICNSNSILYTPCPQLANSDRGAWLNRCCQLPMIAAKHADTCRLTCWHWSKTLSTVPWTAVATAGLN